MRFPYLHITLAILAVPVLMTVTACGGDDEEDGFRLRQSGKAEAVTPSAERKAILARLEVPALKEGNTFVYHNVLYNGHTVMNYCLEFDPGKMHSRWVAFRFDGDTRPIASNVGRTEAWQDDPDLPASMQIGTGYYGGSYNRGHLVASYDRQFSVEANQQTFYMSNMSPQIGAFNSPYWARLENLVQKMGRNQNPYTNFEDTLYVVKGGYIDKNVKGYLSRANGKMVAVPGHYFMALLRIKGKQYDAAGFWLEHKTYAPYIYPDEVPVSTFTDLDQIISIDELEEKTGIDFFHNLPDDVESSVEEKLNTGIWLRPK